MTKNLHLYAVLLFILTGCGALMDKAEPLGVRYFTPSLEPSTGDEMGGAQLSLRLGRIEASEHLRERIAFRLSEHEVGYHEGLRWTEQPESYFRRALGRQLFENGRFEHVVAGVAPTLEAELVAFEDLRERNAVRVEARVLVHDGRRVFLERSQRVEEPRDGDEPAVVAAALSRALQKCVAQITRDVAEALTSQSSRSAPPATPPP
jgi:cholesterol transport system auxiliary component